ncbi:MAG: MBL fold metallo-hydrolase [Lachnospiraceae bacterium]|nr:MBL fold metallo-hydrolase [Lachnospiraceae bacterium]
MVSVATKILTERVRPGEVGFFFMGQAGFILKDSEGRLTAVDLYLTDGTARIAGFKRLMPRILEPSELVFDTVITTHAHPDHFDYDAIPILTEDTRTAFYSSAVGVEEAKKLQIEKTKLLERGGVYEEPGLKIEAVYCDHGELAKDAVGLILTLEGKTIYVAGDTAFRPEMIRDIAARHIDLMVAPINGAFGNLNERQCADYAGIVRPELIVPCHYWCFAEHGGDPGVFANIMKKDYPEIKYNCMYMGESIRI